MVVPLSRVLRSEIILVRFPPVHDKQQQCRCWSLPTALDLLISDWLRRANLLS